MRQGLLQILAEDKHVVHECNNASPLISLKKSWSTYRCSLAGALKRSKGTHVASSSRVRVRRVILWELSGCFGICKTASAISNENRLLSRASGQADHRLPVSEKLLLHRDVERLGSRCTCTSSRLFFRQHWIVSKCAN